ncbi:unnamed protein product [Cyclocybe aegerita]|uniref:Uncharacterized protein n=1 Tax=Cyclocybe aegerita TaxID=1973307 RepID=A0A8S0W7H4_CYCAE|nr:unnamed protein product [Cyclocybe aegerita]
MSYASRRFPSRLWQTGLMLHKVIWAYQEEVDNAPHDNSGQDLLPTLAGMLNSPCRYSLGNPTTTTIDTDPSVEDPGSFTRSATPPLFTDHTRHIHPLNIARIQLFGTNEERTSNSNEEDASASIHEDRDQNLETRPSYTTEFPNSFAVEKAFLTAPEESLAAATSAKSLHLDSSPLGSRLITSDDRGPSLSAPTLRPHSSTTLGSPRISHFESSRGSLTSYAEGFKSTGDGHTDGKLSRTAFHGETKDPKTDSTWRQSDRPADHPGSPPVAAPRSPDVSNPFSQERVSSPTQLNQQASAADPSFICLIETPLESHEATGTDFASDQVKLDPSSPTAYTEHSQSHPYFASATNTRPSGSDIRTGVVGKDLHPRSSPPPSPSMSSNYYPSSSPLPSSSPTEDPIQTPSTSPPQLSGAYNQSDHSSNAEATFYKDENYSAFSHFAMQAPFHPTSQPPQIERSYLDIQQESRFSTPASDSSPYPMGYYAPAPMAPGVTEADMRPNVALSAPTSDPTYTAVEHSPRVMTIPAAEQLSPHADRPEAVATLVLGETSQHSEHTKRSEHQSPQTQHANPIPRPKRSTLAAQRLQHKKLSKPFRSPVVQAPVRLAPKPILPDLSAPMVPSSSAMILPQRNTPLTSGPQPTTTVASSSSQTPDGKLRHRTTRAASQFKSPISAPSTALEEAELVRLTPTIQSLERKLQLLRRALKVREEGQEDVLEDLAKKWSDAGKDAAWEVWDLVKDNVSGEGSSQGKGKKRAFEESWGWDESGDPKKPKEQDRERNWGWDVVPVSERGDDEAPPEVEDAPEEEQEDTQEEEAPRHSLGTMLMGLGIAHETLGWDEEEGNFADN